MTWIALMSHLYCVCLWLTLQTLNSVYKFNMHNISPLLRPVAVPFQLVLSCLVVMCISYYNFMWQAKVRFENVSIWTGALDKYNIHLFISNSKENLKLNHYQNFQLILPMCFHFMRNFVNSIIVRVSHIAVWSFTKIRTNLKIFFSRKVHKNSIIKKGTRSYSHRMFGNRLTHPLPHRNTHWIAYTTSLLTWK